MAEKEEDIVPAVPLPSGGTNKLLLVAMLIGGIALGGGGLFVVNKMTANHEDVTEVDPAAVVVEEVEPEAEYVKEDVSLIEIKRMPASIVDADGNVIGYVFLDLNLEVLTANDPAYVQERLPRIQAEILKEIALHGVTVPGKPGVIDYDGLSVRLSDTANRAIGGDRVRTVFVSRAIRS